MRIVRSQKLRATVIGLVHPAAGTYTITVLPGSPAIKMTSEATDQPAARVSASVRGSAGRDGRSSTTSPAAAISA